MDRKLAHGLGADRILFRDCQKRLRLLIRGLAVETAVHPARSKAQHTLALLDGLVGDIGQQIGAIERYVGVRHRTREREARSLGIERGGFGTGPRGIDFRGLFAEEIE